MYIPKHFELTTEQASALLASAETAQLVVAYADGPEATLLPVEYVPDAAGLGSLNMHVTRTNPVWKKAPLGEALALVSGPDAYVNPEWDPGCAENPGVPTWNYATGHAYGTRVVHDDAEWSRATVSRLSASHGYDVAQVDDRAMELMLRSVVGIELKLTRVLAKGKLSQNKSAAFVESVMAGLAERGAGDDAELAAAMESIALPHARAREQLVEGIRAEHRLGVAKPAR